MPEVTQANATSTGRVLVVDDTPDNLRLLMGLLSDAGFEVATAINGTMAVAAVPSIQPDLILLDIMMPDMDGYEVCRRLKADQRTSEIPVIFISALGETVDILKAFSVGGLDYICKPFSHEEVLARVRIHLDLRRSHLTVQQQKEQLEQEKAEREKTEQQLIKYQEQIAGILTRQLLHPKAFKEIVTASEKMEAIFQYVEALACSSEPVLIVGESGVGKELIAKAVHDVCCPEGPWVAVNIAGFDDNHFSDTLFGHVKGAFTGADQERAGMIEQAAGGTLFLDEIGDLSLASQVKLLRLLQENEYLPLGSDLNRKANTRIVVATNVDLKTKIDDKSFRKDLYYRLSVHCIKIPALRERKEDIPLLLEYFLENAAREMNKKKPNYPAELPILLKNHLFPGNMREFRAMVFDALSKHRGRTLSMESFEQQLELPARKLSAAKTAHGGAEVVFQDLLPTLKEVSTLLTKEALLRTEGNQSMAAKLLGVTPAALSLRLKKMSSSLS